MRRTLVALAVVACAPAALFLVACEEKSSSTAAARSDAGAGTDKYATADSKLTKALQAAASASAGADNGPPPDGIFAPGVADHRHPKGKPTTLEIVSEGAEPRVSLAGGASPDAMRATSYGPAALRISEVRGRAPRPTVDFTFSLGPAKKDDGGADWLVADIKKAAPAPASQQPGALPPGMDKEIGSLAGTQLRLNVTPDGRLGDVALQLGKTTQPTLDLLARSAAETMALLTVPLPDKPVGVGAQWIAETRMPYEGLDVITYRAYRVKSIADNRAHLTVDVKSYAADKDPQIPGVPKDATFVQYEAAMQAELEVVRGESLARVADLQGRDSLVFQAPGSPAPDPTSGQPQAGLMELQIQIQATLARGDDLRAASAKP
jgi:hypothetical protein